MRITTALYHERLFLERIQEILWSTRRGGRAHGWALKQWAKRIVEDPAWKRVPRWVQQKVHDRFSEGLRQMYTVVEHHSDYEQRLANATAGREVKPAAFVRWQLRVDGEFTTIDEISARRQAGDEDIWKRVEGAHIWNHKPENTYDSCGWKGIGENKE